MNNTSPLFQEQMAQRNAEEIQRQLKESTALEFDTPEPRPEWLAHQLTNLADWMIRTGEHLRQRYDHESSHTGHTHVLSHQ